MINEEVNKDNSLFIQAIVSNHISWKVNTSNLSDIREFIVKTTLSRVDIYPDLKITSAIAKSGYVIHSLPKLHEIKSSINNWILANFNSSNTTNIDMNVRIGIDNIIYRSIAHNNVATFIASKDFVKNIGETSLDNWDKVFITISGGLEEEVFGQATKNIINNKGSLLIEQILPSLIISVKSDLKQDQHSSKLNHEVATYGSPAATRDHQILLNKIAAIENGQF